MGNYKNILVGDSEYRPFILVLTVLFIIIFINNSYADIDITLHTIGDIPFEFGQFIFPTLKNPLEFEFVSDESVNFTCRIVQVNENTFRNLLYAYYVNDNANFTGNVIESRDCGSGTVGSVKYDHSFLDGLYIFELTAIYNNSTIERSFWGFESLAELEKNAYKKVRIIESKIGEDIFKSGEIINPTSKNPLEFEFESDKSVNFTCRIVQVNEEIIFELIEPRVINHNYNFTGNIIESIDCGSGTAGSVNYDHSFLDGFYIFELIGSNGTLINERYILPFEVR